MKTVSYRVYCQALSKLREKLGGDRRIEVYDMNGGFGRPAWRELGGYRNRPRRRSAGVRQSAYGSRRRR